MHGILDYLETSAAHFPEKTAIAYMDESYTFHELQEYAARLGSSIHKLGISGKPVGVIVNRGIETAVFILAAVYSGNYYLPIDPAMPASKIESILEDSGTRLLLGSSLDSRFLDAVHFSGTTLSLADLDVEKAVAPDLASSDAPLYLIYTSGSTGKPKGVLKSHGSIISFIEAFCSCFGLDEREVIGNQTPFFFDASAKDFYLMLRTGATLVIIPSEYFMFPPKLMDYVGSKNITYICWVPTALSMVAQMNSFQFQNCEKLKNVFFVGEVFPVKQLNKWLEMRPDIRYVNLYGSSELAGICCYYELSSQVPESGLPLGKPLSNCKLTLRDGNDVIMAPGILGEICIESDALALCYFNDEARTSASFVSEVVNGIPHRVFHSGDLARYDYDGNLVFSSRKDFQIKYLGKRIELGEIESVADRMPELSRCCCLYNAVHQQIHLFCELNSGAAIDLKGIRIFLKKNLSDYMVPHKITILEEMPYNANGKIDRVYLNSLIG